ncbi:MAG: class I SAM-dependent methyltransferase [Chlorobiaceae bacterium]|nr:class I SAM-dependent methyltransferase [Chlorobiaceae bacterium]NTV25367.1 class I SAM-dependent methyltransferase [Chlorobiaceae bacterium]
MVVKKLDCPVCGGNALLKYSGHPGYVYDRKYDIYACEACDVSFVYPLRVEKRDYDEIYGEAESISGYDKYYALSQKILASDHPIDLITRLGDEYAYVVRRIQELMNKGASILEVGCGFGYLTYSLNKAGYDATGVDVSEVSIDRAIRTYGSYYQCIGFNDFSTLQDRRFDCIVLTEVIEHVVDPVAFLESLRKLLVKGGVILMTTPNKSAFPAKALWMTDAPPIHLWWFSEKSMKIIAGKARLDATVYRGHVSDNMSYHYWRKDENIGLPVFVPEFDRDGKLLKNEREYHLDVSKPPLLRRLYARFVPQELDSIVIRLKNRISDVQKSEKHCTMFVELKQKD